MSKSDPRLANCRAARNRARTEFKRQLGLAKVDLAPTMLKRRVIAEAQRSALSVTYQAIDIANDSRGVAAATGAALVMWLARKPIFAGANTLFNRFQNRHTPKSIGDRIKLLKAEYWRKLKDYADDQ